MSELSDYLATRKDITVTFRFVGLRDGDQGFQLIWSAEVNGVRFDYFTGSAWLKPKVFNQAKMSYRRDKFIYTAGEWVSADEALKRGLARLDEPSPADLISCLVSDADSSSESFADWCSNLGYDEDSRKALSTYLACQENGARLRKAIGHEAYTALHNLEH